MKPQRKIDYLKCRNGVWYVRVQDTATGQDFARSLQTRDKLEAEVKAAEFITQHKARILARRPRVVTEWVHAYTPGQSHSDGNGGQIIATDRELIYLNHNGAVTKTTPNGRNMVHLEGNVPGVDMNAPAPERYTPRYLETLHALMHTAPKSKANTIDDAVIDFYVKENGFADGSQAHRETYQAWEVFQKLVGKPLAKCTRDDGRKLVAHYEAKGLKSASVKKIVGRLCAACNLAIDENKLSYNPFSGVAKLRDDKLIRVPLDDADMKTCFDNLGALSASDQLLFRVLASTGMRLSEAFQINSEKTEMGIRYVVIGRKTKQSKRRVPVPASLLPFLPERITAPLFTGDPNQASTRLGTWLDDVCKITDPAKVAAHSLRHRAQDQMRAHGCPPEIREELFGRDKETVGKHYGLGHPVTVLRQWIDKLS